MAASLNQGFDAVIDSIPSASGNAGAGEAPAAGKAAVIRHWPVMTAAAQPRPRAAIEIVSPYDQSLIATADDADRDDIDQALATAHACYLNRSSWLPPAKRIEIFERAAALIGERAEELALAVAREGGKPLADSRVEIARSLDSIKSCIDCIRTHSGRELPMNLNQDSSQRLALTRFEPLGVVVAVSAFNHPFNLVMHQVGAAIAAGCPVIVKPASYTPIPCFLLLEILREAGLPDEYCQGFACSDNRVAEALVADPRVAFFSFIGSAGVGWHLRSKLAPGTRCALEHGGVAPALVCADADLERALPALLRGGFYHAGQVCVSVQRVYAHASIARDFALSLAERASALKVGDPTDASTDVGPLIRPREVERIASWVEEAVAAGAELLTGGNRIGESCYAPTVLFDPPASAQVSCREAFGPVVCVYPFTELDDAIARANSLPVAFQAAVFTRDLDTALYCGERIRASAVMVNDHTAFRVDWMPFAGLGQSGLGVGGIPYSFEEMQIEKMLVVHSPALS